MFNNSKKDYFWNTLGVFLQNLLSPILLIFITRFNGIEDGGLFSFTFSMAVSFSAISIWGNRTYQVSDIKNQFNNKNYILSRIITSLITIIASLIFVLLNGYSFNKIMLLMIFVLVKIIESIADVIYGIMQTDGKLYISGISLSIKSIASLIIFGLVDLITNSILMAGLSMILINLLVFFLFDIKYAKHNIEDKADVNEAIKILKVSSPAFVVSFLSLFTLTIIRYFIDLNNPNDITYFNIFSMPITIIILVASFIIQPNVLSLSKKYNYYKKKFYSEVSRIVFFIILMGLIATIMVGLIGDKVVEIIFKANMDSRLISLIIMVVGATFGSIISIYCTIFNIMRKLKYHVLILFITNSILIMICYIIKANIDLLMGSILFAATSFIQCVIMSYVLFIKLKYNKE